jgi:hypothetical protein
MRPPTLRCVVALATVCLAFFATSAVADVSFSSPVVIANPGGPIRTRLGDLNGDGITDLVVLNNGSNSVNVRLGTGGGAFQPPVSYPVGAGPTELVVIDVNNDGKPDLVVLNTGGNSVSVLRGNGDGTFVATETIGVGSDPLHFDVFKDSDHLGRIVTANAGGNSISYLAMQAGGAFAPVATLAVGKAPSFVIHADLDGDGSAELVVSNGGDGTISVVTRNAAGVPATSVARPVGTGPSWLASGDATGDGKVDLAVSNTGSSDLTLFIGNGDRSFLGPFTLAVGPGPREIRVADLNGDGIADAVVRNADGTFTVFKGGVGTFTTYDGGGASVALGMDLLDADGDGKLDILAVVTGTGMFAVLPGNGDGTFGAARTFAAGSSLSPQWSAADIDGDGTLDVAIPSSDTIVLLLQRRGTPDVRGVVTEFYNTPLDNYFITADPNEAAAIDNGSAGPGWARTGVDFNFNSGGDTPVCRFYGSITPGPNSHFYTSSAAECAELKALQQSTPASSPRWNFESLDFITTNPSRGACPSGSRPVYRAYNNGFDRHVDSNHRITGEPAGIAQVVARGWISEGVVMCSPASP